MESRRKWGKLVLYFLLGLILLYLVFPFIWAISSSLKSDNQLIMTPATFLPRDPVSGEISFYWGNFTNVLHNSVFLNGLKNSAIVSVSTTLLALIVGAFAAFALGKLHFKGRTAMMYLVLSITMFPQISVLTGLYAVIRNIGVDVMTGMILSYMLFTLPFTVWVMSSFFKGLPDALLEAASIDGASFFQSFYLVLLPLTLPAIVTTGLLAFIAAWNEYLFALTFTSLKQADRTVPVAIAMFSGQSAHQEPFGTIMAASIIVTVPLLILVFLMQKKIIGGLTAGAVKE